MSIEVHSESVMDTVVGFLETCPKLETSTIKFGPRVVGEDSSVFMQKVYIDGVQYLFQCKQVG